MAGEDKDSVWTQYLAELNLLEKLSQMQLDTKPRHFRHQNINKNKSAKIQLITSSHILFSLVNDFI